VDNYCVNNSSVKVNIHISPIYDNHQTITLFYLFIYFIIELYRSTHTKKEEKKTKTKPLTIKHHTLGLVSAQKTNNAGFGFWFCWFLVLLANFSRHHYSLGSVPECLPKSFSRLLAQYFYRPDAHPVT